MKNTLPSLANFLKNLAPSSTILTNQLAKKRAAEGHRVFNLTAGEPDFHLHPIIQKAVIQGVEQNHCRYTEVAGLKELRERVAFLYNRSFDEITISNGGKQALFNSLICILDPDDEVLIPSPCWVSFPEMVKLCHAKPIMAETKSQNQFKMTAEDFEKHLKHNKKIKALILNSPNNPTGSMYTENELRVFGEIIKKVAPHLWVICDEIYSRIVFDENQHCSFLNACPELAEQIVIINGLSKSHALTGWRIGWSLAPKKLSHAIQMIQSQTTSNVNNLAQIAAISALPVYPEEKSLNEILDRELEKQLRYLTIKRNLLSDGLMNLPQITFDLPRGALFIFANFSSLHLKDETTIQLAERILIETGVALVPGDGFGIPGYLRISFSGSESTIKEACQRLAEYFLESKKNSILIG